MKTTLGRALLIACMLSVGLVAGPEPARAAHLFEAWTDVNADRILSPQTGKGGANQQYLGEMLRRAFYSAAASSGLYSVADRTALAAILKATLTTTAALPGVTEIVVRVASDTDSKPRRYRWKASDATATSDYVLATGEGGTGRWFATIDDLADNASAGLLDADFAGTYAGALIRTGSAAYSVLKHSLAAGAAPAGTDDGPDGGYAIGSLWIDTTSNPRALYMAVDVSDNAAVWRKLSDGTEIRHAAFAGSATGKLIRTGSATYAVVKDNYSGGAAPAGTDDGPDGGYAVGSMWVDVTSSPRAVYFAVNVADNAAVWRKLDGTEVLDGDFSTNGAMERTGAGTYSSRAMISSSGGAGDSTKIPVLNGSGVLDASFLPADGVTNARLGTDVKVGSLATLTTSTQVSCTAAINEVDANADTANASVAAAVTDTGGGGGNVGKLVELDGSGLLDGRDIATDGTKLDGVEAGADNVSAASVAAAGAVMDSDFAGSSLATLVRTGAGAYAPYRIGSAAANPALTDDTPDGGYAPGSYWINTTTKEGFLLVDGTDNAAVWRTHAPIRTRAGKAAGADRITNTATKTAFATTGLTIPINASVGSRLTGGVFVEIEGAEADEEVVISVEAGAGGVIAASASAVRAAGVEIVLTWDLVVTVTGGSGKASGVTTVWINAVPTTLQVFDLALDLSAARVITAYADNETASLNNHVDLSVFDSEFQSL